MTTISIQDEIHWHQLRSQNVGGSEVAALFDACSYLTRLELWLTKRGEIPGDIPDNDRMFWGRLLEEGIARGLAEKRSWNVENPFGYFTCDDTPGMGCTPDRVIHDPGRPKPGLLQIKNVDRLVFMRWEDGQPPLQYQLQLQHELACAGYDWGVLAVLVGGNDLQVFEYDAHPVAIARIKRAVSDFWTSVREGIQPKAVAEDYDILRDLYGDTNGPPVDMTGNNELPGLCAVALDAAERRKSADKDEKAAKAEILQIVGDAGRAVCAGFELKKVRVHKDPYMVAEQNYTMLKIKKEKTA